MQADDERLREIRERCENARKRDMIPIAAVLSNNDREYLLTQLADVTAERDAALAEVERLRARLSEHEQPELLPCTDCNRDWGHSYCGVCGGSGFVRNPRSIAALKGTP